MKNHIADAGQNNHGRYIEYIEHTRCGPLRVRTNTGHFENTCICFFTEVAVSYGVCLQHGCLYLGQTAKHKYSSLLCFQIKK